MNKAKVKTKDLFDLNNCLLKQYLEATTYPWEILPEIKNIVKQIIKEGIEGYSYLKDDVLVGKDVIVSPFATLNGPLIIGHHTEIRPGAYIRGNVIIGERCVIGNSCEFKNCILLNDVQVPHYSYVGDSILGNHTHLGAGAICSNLRSDGKNVVVHAEIDYQTNLRKFGAILGDYADVGCQSVLNPGTIIGPHTQIYPLSMVRSVVPEKSIYKNRNEIVRKKEEK